MPKLAKESAVNHAHRIRVLRSMAGDIWELEFRADEFDIHEVIKLPVPRLLPDETIKAVCRRLDAVRSYLHKPPRSKHDYLLSNYVFCGTCGYSLSGQAVTHTGKTHLYYGHGRDARRQCPLRPYPWVRSDKLERQVVNELFNLFGNPAAVERAVQNAVPDCDKAR